MKHFAMLGALLTGTVSISCCFMSGMDALGRESAITETKNNEEVIEDDKIEDKHPEYDPDRTVDEAFRT